MIYKVKSETIDEIANAIKLKRKTDEKIKPEDFAEEILAIETGENTESALDSANRARASAASAESSALAAAESAGLAAKNNGESEGWATGEINGAPVAPDAPQYKNNSKYYCKEAKNAAKHAAENAVKEAEDRLEGYVNDATAAKEAAEAAQKAAEEAAKTAADDAVENAKELLEGYVTDAEAAKDAAESAQEISESARDEAVSAKDEAKSSEESAADSAAKALEAANSTGGLNAEAWAVGTMGGVEITSKEEHEAYQNNSKYWSQIARQVVENAQANMGTSNVLATAVVTP